MLLHLRVQNLGLIQDAEIEPGPGLTVITGETGAGKTLLLGALRLLSGEPADPGYVGRFADSAQADGLFGTQPGELGVSRIVPREGRSRSHLDGTVVSAGALQDRLAGIVQIVGQHDQIELKKGRVILELIDANLNDAGRTLLQAYTAAWTDLQAHLEEQKLLGGSQRELARQLDLVRYQRTEIEAAGFSDGDDAELESHGLRLRNAGEIRENLQAALAAVEGIESNIGDLIAHLRKIRDLDPGTAPLTESAETLGYSFDDLSRELTSYAESLIDDPEAKSLIESRLNLLGTLKMKYGRTLREVIEFGEASKRKEEELAGLLDRAESIESEVERAWTRVRDSAAALSKARLEVAGTIEESTQTHLRDLALESSSVRFEFEEIEPGARGADRIKLLFSSHDSLEPGDLARIASGGELSRLVLAINLATGRGGAATLVFDEVDAGVGGATALAMARKLASLAKGQQVLCVTHLPQVAAFADTHYVVSRTEATASVAGCVGAARLAELSRMIAGLPESERGQQAAAELLELASK
jgi:DNA repair protein RecN (Recombination protein N)